MKYFNIEISTGKILSLNDCVQEVPDTVMVREAKEGEDILFFKGNLIYDKNKDTLVKGLIVEADELKQQMIVEGNRILNALAKSKGFLDLNDAMSFANSNVPTIRADAEKAIELRDQMRVQINSIVSDLSSNPIAISLEDAMKKITPLVW